MKIVIAPDSFKESLSALQVATAIEQGIKQVIPTANVIKVPAADGGEGTIDTLVDATGGRFIETEVTGPLGRPTMALLALLGDGTCAAIEMAQASGLHLVEPSQRDPRITTTYGTGQLISAALDAGATKLLLGLGGSATNDGGAGMAQALGVKLLDANGNELAHGGAGLVNLATIDTSGIDPRLAKLEVQVACDVDNPLCGERGASAIFGPQKGASTTMVAQLDEALQHYGNTIEQQLGISVLTAAGSGAAGGMGAASLAFLGATLRPGIELVLDAIGLEQQLEGADLVITGEGRLDAQSAHGKTPVGVAQRAKGKQIPVIAIAGSIKEDAAILHQHGIDAMFDSVTAPMDFEQVKKLTAANLEQTAANVMRLWKLARQSR